MTDPSEATDVYDDENGKPVRGSIQVSDPASSDRYIQASRDLQGVCEAGEGPSPSTATPITPRGSELIERAAPQHVADVRDAVIDQLSATERATLTVVADKVRARLAAQDPAG